MEFILKIAGARHPYRMIRPLAFFLIWLALNTRQSTAALDFKTLFDMVEKDCNKINNRQKPLTGKHCKGIFQFASCWENTKAGDTFETKCPKLFFYENETVSRRCNESGVWEKEIDISKCVMLTSEDANEVRKLIAYQHNLEIELEKHHYNMTRMYFVSSWIALCIMTITLIILVFVSGWHNENPHFDMHKNLIITFIIEDITFLIDYYAELSAKPNMRHACNAFWALNRMASVAEVTWMLMGCVFMARLFIRPYNRNMSLIPYCLVGWGFPIILTFAVYIPVVSSVEGGGSCWTHFSQSTVMLVLYVPMTVMLGVNIIILIALLNIVLQKLKQDKIPEAQKLWKLLKGAVLMIPPVGIFYLLIFFYPKGNKYLDYFLRLCHPIQGLLLSIHCVVLSKDVQDKFKQRRRQWRTQRSLINQHRRAFSQTNGMSMDFTLVDGGDQWSQPAEKIVQYRKVSDHDDDERIHSGESNHSDHSLPSTTEQPPMAGEGRKHRQTVISISLTDADSIHLHKLGASWISQSQEISPDECPQCGAEGENLPNHVEVTVCKRSDMVHPRTNDSPGERESFFQGVVKRHSSWRNTRKPFREVKVRRTVSNPDISSQVIQNKENKSSQGEEREITKVPSPRKRQQTRAADSTKEIGSGDLSEREENSQETTERRNEKTSSAPCHEKKNHNASSLDEEERNTRVSEETQCVCPKTSVRSDVAVFDAGQNSCSRAMSPFVTVITTYEPTSNGGASYTTKCTLSTDHYHATSII